MTKISVIGEPRDLHGHFASKTKPSVSLPPSPADPPLVSLKITNPITYLRLWWRRVMSNEGVDFRFRVHPLTAIAIVVLVTTGSFGLGLFAKTPVAKFLKLDKLISAPQNPLTSSISPIQETAFTGILRYSDVTNQYYLTTTSSQAITLDVPANVSLAKLIGKRIFAAGSFNKDTGVLQVKDAKSMEVLPPQITPVLIISPPSAVPATR